MDKNKQQLLIRWALPGLIALFFLVKAIQDPGIIIQQIIPGLLLIGFIYLWFKNRGEGRIKRSIRKSTPKQALKYYDRSVLEIAMTPELFFTQSYYKSLTLTFYGQFEDALAELNQHDISDFHPVYEGMRLNGIVVNKYLQKIDLKNAQNTASQSFALCKNPKVLPGHKNRGNHYEAYIEIGEILNKTANDNTIVRLERRFRRANYPLKFMIAWSLGTYYQANGFKKRAEAKKKFLEKNAPFCDPLHDF